MIKFIFLYLNIFWFLKKTTLEVLTYESKENTDKFININTDFKYEKTENITLTCVESKKSPLKK